MSIYSCVRPKFIKSMHLWMPSSPLHIALCQLSALGFPCFFTAHYNIGFVLENVFHDGNGKIPCIELRVTVISLRGGCRTLPTYKM